MVVAYPWLGSIAPTVPIVDILWAKAKASPDPIRADVGTGG